MINATPICSYCADCGAKMYLAEPGEIGTVDRCPVCAANERPTKMTSADMHVAASIATPTTTGVEHGLDGSDLRMVLNEIAVTCGEECIAALPAEVLS